MSKSKIEMIVSFPSGRDSAEAAGVKNFVAKMLREKEFSTGLICAPTFKEISTVITPLLEAYFELNQIGYVINKRPPTEWRIPKTLRSYRHMITLQNGIHIHMRCMKGLGFLKGIESSWVWMSQASRFDKEHRASVINTLREERSDGYAMCLTDRRFKKPPEGFSSKDFERNVLEGLAFS